MPVEYQAEISGRIILIFDNQLERVKIGVMRCGIY
jgi:hypothetical protein